MGKIAPLIKETNQKQMTTTRDLDNQQKTKTNTEYFTNKNHKPVNMLIKIVSKLNKVKAFYTLDQQRERKVMETNKKTQMKTMIT